MGDRSYFLWNVDRYNTMDRQDIDRAQDEDENDIYS